MKILIDHNKYMNNLLSNGGLGHSPQDNILLLEGGHTSGGLEEVDLAKKKNSHYHWS